MDSLPVSLIDTFLTDYEPANLGRPMTVEERALAEEVLFDFIVADLSAEPPSSCAAALADIRALVAADSPALEDQVGVHLRRIELAGRLMSCQMQRREKSFDMMREHLVMLSHQQPADRPVMPPSGE